MTYVERVESYRRHLWRLVLTQSHGYPHHFAGSKWKLINKLMMYARRAGFNYNTVFGEQPKNLETLPRYAGKRLKEKMAAAKHPLQGRRLKKISRHVAHDPFELRRMGDRIVFKRCVPSVPIEPIVFSDVSQAVLVINHKRGELRIRDENRVEHVYPWVIDDSKTTTEATDAWGALSIEHHLGARPLFREARVLKRPAGFEQ
jgi:hypothetical protein